MLWTWNQRQRTSALASNLYVFNDITFVWLRQPLMRKQWKTFLSLALPFQTERIFPRPDNTCKVCSIFQCTKPFVSSFLVKVNQWRNNLPGHVEYECNLPHSLCYLHTIFQLVTKLVHQQIASYYQILIVFYAFFVTIVSGRLVYNLLYNSGGVNRWWR